MKREQAYLNIIKQNNLKSVVEVGVWNGDLSLLALNNCPSIVSYYLVDPLREETNNFPYKSENYDFPKMMAGDRYICNMGGKTRSQADLDQMYLEILSKISVFPSARFIREQSTQAAEQFDNDSLDMVFIDAIHLYENVKEDIFTWLPKVKHGGILAGDDYSPSFPGVVHAVQEVFKNSFCAHDNIWYTIKH